MPVMQHIALNCRDKAAQERFYCRTFGFERARVFLAGTPEEFVMLRLGSMRLELFTAAADGAGSGGEQAVGFKHLAFAVDDLDGRLAALREAGIEPDPIIDCGGMLPGLRVCFFRDPEGNILELMEGYADQDDVPPLEG